MDFSSMKIVSIDDNENNLFLIEAICSELNLNVTSFLDPIEALVYVVQHQVDMIIIDYMMPGINGIEFIQEYRTAHRDVPIIMVTAAGSDDEIHKKAFEVGVNDFLSKPVNSLLFKARVTNLLINYKNMQLVNDKAKLLEVEVEKATIAIREREHESLAMLGKTAEYKDPETASHVSRVAHYSKILAKAYGLDEHQQDLIFYASPFHDLGKVGIEDKVLLKPGKLNDEEFDIIKTHVNIGYDILKDAKSEYLKVGANIAISHHEKYDGTGYPYGIKGENIDIYGRIVAVADVFDALTSKRPYKEPWSFEKAMNILIEDKNKHFDPKLVDLFVQNIDKIKQVYNDFSNS
jgi:putative two-component system response regulator